MPIQNSDKNKRISQYFWVMNNIKFTLFLCIVHVESRRQQLLQTSLSSKLFIDSCL